MRYAMDMQFICNPWPEGRKIENLPLFSLQVYYAADNTFLIKGASIYLEEINFLCTLNRNESQLGLIIHRICFGQTFGQVHNKG